MADVYQNPVHPAACPDPYVLYHCGTYWAWCSGVASDGRQFGTFRSTDLVHWTDMGGALVPLSGDHPCYWAPEVTYVDGRFYMYYSVGNEVHMEIRVAVSDAPEGPFIDSGHRLTHVQFAIDAHVFHDSDGQRWMFYATDFVDDEPIGTGTVRDRMLDLFTLEGRAEVVTRAAYDWQVYDPARAEKGGVRWHTVEGPFVVRHKGLYYQMFSGGNWTNVTYGVGYATSAAVAGTPWRQHCDGRTVQPLLRTIPGQVIGPGHNSAVLGPDRMQMFCVYHRWTDDLSERVMAVDRLDWAGERLLVLGPTSTPQPAPTLAQPLFSNSRWTLEGEEWRHEDDRLAWTTSAGAGSARLSLPCPSVVVEVWMRAGVRVLDPLLNTSLPLRHVSPPEDGSISLRVGAAETLLDVAFAPVGRRAEIRCGGRVDRLSLGDVDFGWPHALRLQLDGRRASVELDGRLLWQGLLPEPATFIELAASDVSAEFQAGRLTVGWEETFGPVEGDETLTAWTGEAHCWRVDEHLLRRVEATPPARLRRGPPLASYEWVVNLRVRRPVAGAWRLHPVDGGVAFSLDGAPGRWRLEAGGAGTWALPADFDPRDFHQFRFRKQGERLSVSLEAALLGEARVDPAPSTVSIEAVSDSVDVDLVRCTMLTT